LLIGRWRGNLEPVGASPPFETRPLAPADRAAARQLAVAAGVHGVYVANALEHGEGEGLLCWGGGRLLGCLWFGPRGNLIVLADESLSPQHVADAVQASCWPWRIALGPDQAIAALAGRVVGAPLVLREQVYHGCAPTAAAGELAAATARSAVRQDRDRLMAATLELNHSDLHVDPRRVDRRWLRQTVDARIADGSTLVLGAVGDVRCKLDVGSRGAAGTVLEGVFTFPEHRGRGLATSLVAAAAVSAPAPLVCLHVAADNTPARTAYERAGLLTLDRCRLLLLG
jgi:GNAT superfamily N-acetyltransferase